MAKSGIDWFKLGITVCRVFMACSIIYMGWVVFDDPGERVYNKYMHALRKMQMPKSKPGDIAFGSIKFDDLNKKVI